MTEIDAALVGVSGAITVTLISAFTAYKLQERSAMNRLRQEVALRPYVDRVAALKAVYLGLVDCTDQLIRSMTITPQTIQEYQERVAEPVDAFRRTLYRNSIWLSKVESRVLDVLGTFNQLGLALLKRMPNQLTPGESLSDYPIPYEGIIRKPTAASKAIADELGVDILEGQLQDIFNKLKDGSTTSSASTSASVQPVSQSQNRDIDLRKIDLAANHRLGMLVTMISAYIALIVGLLIAWYQKYGSGDPTVYYTGIALISGVLGAMLVTQELIPYKNWFKQVDGWLQKIENNERLPKVTELVGLKDQLKSTGHLMYIFIIVVDFYLTVLGNYDKIQLLVVSLVAAVIVFLLTQGGLRAISRYRKSRSQAGQPGRTTSPNVPTSFLGFELPALVVTLRALLTQCKSKRIAVQSFDFGTVSLAAAMALTAVGVRFHIAVKAQFGVSL